MAHFAKLDKDNIVISVHVINNDVLMVDGVESEQAGIDFLKELYNHESWKQTSYNATFRKHFAGVGFQYDPEWDVFIPLRPYPSWKLDYDTFIWRSPIPEPEKIEGHIWKWGEVNQEWVSVELPTE